LSSLNSRITFLLQSLQNLLLSNLQTNFIQKVSKLLYTDYKHTQIHIRTFNQKVALDNKGCRHLSSALRLGIWNLSTAPSG
jgi:hypothetical protein